MRDLVELPFCLCGRVGVVLLLGELEHDRQVVDPLAQLGEAAQVGLQVGELARDLLCLVDVVPEVGSGSLLFEVGDLLAHPVRVEDLLDGRESLVERADLDADITGCHVRQGYAARRPSPSCGGSGTCPWLPKRVFPATR